MESSANDVKRGCSSGKSQRKRGVRKSCFRHEHNARDASRRESETGRKTRRAWDEPVSQSTKF